MAKKGKIAIKKWGFRGKKQVIGVEKLWVGNQTRKAKWGKMQVLISKKTKQKEWKVRNDGYLPTLWPTISLERSEN